MPRRPEIGNIQLYPNRPLRQSDRNGYVLKFFCPIKGKRIRRNCGTRDRRQARRILRECRERLLNGEYVSSGGAITEAQHITAIIPESSSDTGQTVPKTWQECYERYREHRKKRTRERSLSDALLRLNVAERIFTGFYSDRGMQEELPVDACMTLDMLEYLQDRLLAGDESRLDSRSPNTVNSMMGAVMAFVRYCAKHGWIKAVPAVEKLEVDGVMKGRPITGEEFERMLESTPMVVGAESAASWQFALRVLWESGFRVGDLMDFSWGGDRHIHPVWPSGDSAHPTIVVPSTQKNGLAQEIPMLPGLEELLNSVPHRSRLQWVVDPQPMQYQIRCSEYVRPTAKDLQMLARQFSNCSIARSCGVTETTVRKWLRTEGIPQNRLNTRASGEIPETVFAPVHNRGRIRAGRAARRIESGRLTKERVSRIISLIGKQAGIVVRQEDDRTGQRIKYASAHDIRRGCAQRLINVGVSAETLKVVLRHKDFATTEKFYGATRSAQSAATEVRSKLLSSTDSPAFVGGLMGGTKEAPRFSAEELEKLKSLLNSL